MPNGDMSGIVGSFYKEQVEIHKDDLIELENEIMLSMDDFVNELANKVKYKGDLIVSDLLVRQVVKRFFYDVVKFQHFHGFYDRNKKINKFKKAAILTHWLIKFEPIQIIDSGVNKRDHVFSSVINHEFAFDYCLLLVDVESKDQDLLPSLSNTKKRMVHNFGHREFNIPIFVHFLEYVSALKTSKTENNKNKRSVIKQKLEIEELKKELKNIKLELSRSQSGI